MSTLAPWEYTVLLLVIALPLITLSGCSGVQESILESTGTADRPDGNAFRVSTDSSPDEAIKNLTSFLERQDIQVNSAAGNTIKTKPTTMSGGGNAVRSASQQTIRMKAVVEPAEGGSEIVVIGQYQAGATGEWKRAQAESGNPYTTTPGQAFMTIGDLLRQGYGGDSVDDTSVDMNYVGSKLPTGPQTQMGGQKQMDGQKGGITSVKIGGRLGLPLGDLSDAATLHLGAEGRVGLGSLPVTANASFDYYLTDVNNVSYFAVDLNALYEFEVDSPTLVPYIGGGIGITRLSSSTGQTQFGSFSASSTEVGLNLLGGARFPLGSIDPFAQLNATVGGSAQRVGITGGLLFGL